MMDVLFSLAVLAAFALIGGGGWRLARRGGKRLDAALMIGVGVIVLINVWINSMPVGAPVQLPVRQ